MFKMETFCPLTCGLSSFRLGKLNACLTAHKRFTRAVVRFQTSAADQRISRYKADIIEVKYHNIVYNVLCMNVHDMGTWRNMFHHILKSHF